MKTFFSVLVIFFLTGSVLFSQEKNWRLDLFNFFDNTEFARSAVTIPQTMAGVQVAPELGFVWDSVHTVNIGINLLHEYGSSSPVVIFYPTAYYEFFNGKVRLIMGAFPRSRAIANYPRLFFRDSISYYRSNINGIFLEYTRDQNYINLWLDWTGRQSKTVNEAFFIGFSGRYKPGIFYLQHFGYMYHFASKLDPVVEESLHDNLLFHTSAGVDFSEGTGFRKLEVDAGWVSGLERSRGDNTGWISSNGVIVETRLEYKWFGIYNSFYKGGGLMNFYRDHGNELYWGDPVYRAKTYNRCDLYLNFIQSRNVNIELTWSLHFLENRVYNEQMLKVIVNLSSLKI